MFARRDFLKSTIAGFAVPFLGYQKPNWDLQFLTIDSKEYEIIKGPYSVKTQVYAGDDLRDCHGLCATYEWACVLKHELEYGQEGLKKLSEMAWDCPDPGNGLVMISESSRERLLKELKRVEVTPEEYKKLILFCKKLRGKHSCCLS